MDKGMLLLAEGLVAAGEVEGVTGLTFSLSSL